MASTLKCLLGEKFRVRGSGMRSAPEVLWLELLNLVFNSKEVIDNHYSPTELEGKNARFFNPEIAPNEWFHGDEGRFVGQSFRGAKIGSLRSHDPASKQKYFYAPAYPALASGFWLRSNEAEVIRGFLFHGPLAHYLAEISSPEKMKKETREFAELMVTALLGDSESGDEMDVMAKAIEKGAPVRVFREKAILRILELLPPDCKGGDVFLSETAKFGEKQDPFPLTVFQDLRLLLSLEKQVSRVEWIELMLAYLRMVVPMWVFAQYQGTIQLRDWLFGILDAKKNPPTQEEIVRSFMKRGESLLQPSATPDAPIDRMVSEYMKADIQVQQLLEDMVNAGCLEKKRVEDKICLSGGKSSGYQNLEGFLQKISEVREQYTDYAKKEVDLTTSNEIARTRVDRLSSKEPVFRNPLKNSGKSYATLNNVLWGTDDEDEHQSHLLLRAGTTKRQFYVSPGPVMLHLFVALASKDRNEKFRSVVLSDIEEKFADYGIDFAARSDGRDILIKKLAQIGLLNGSPDAGPAVDILNPYAKQVETALNELNPGASHD